MLSSAFGKSTLRYLETIKDAAPDMISCRVLIRASLRRDGYTTCWTNYCGLFVCKLGRADSFRRTLDTVRRLRKRIYFDIARERADGKFANECLLTVYDSTRAHIRVRVPPHGGVHALAKALTLAKWADSMLGGVNVVYVNREQLDNQVSRFKSVFTTAELADAGDEDWDLHGELFDADAGDEDLDEKCGQYGLVNGLPWAFTGLSCGDVCFETSPGIIAEARDRLVTAIADDSKLQSHLETVHALLPAVSGHGVDLMHALQRDELPLAMFDQLRNRLLG